MLRNRKPRVRGNAAPRSLRKLVLAALAGGSLCQTCETRLRDAFVDGTKNYISTLLDPSVFLENALADGLDE